MKGSESAVVLNLNPLFQHREPNLSNNSSHVNDPLSTEDDALLLQMGYKQVINRLL